MFKWFKRKQTEDKKHVPTLHGYSLDEWEFIGITQITYTDENKNSLATGEVFFFMKKNDPDWREYKLTHVSKWAPFETHPFVRTRAELWKANQLKIYESIGIPSDYLRSYMKDVYEFEWSTEKNWWVHSEDAKYEKSLRQQNKKPKIIAEQTSDNTATKVVKVDFTKKT